MLTARASGDDILDGIDMGANDYIPKPFDPETLIKSVRENLKPHIIAGGLAPGLFYADPSDRIIRKGFR
jgi:DNA-binding response OmpR family regulator